jgi:hypothetical protein
MATDSSDFDRPEPTPSFELPGIRDVSIRRVQFISPERRNFKSAMTAVDNAVEFVVETSAPIPIRALGPALFIGDVAITEVTADDDHHYRFVALAPETLEQDARISLGWTDRSSTRVESAFTYRG